MPTKTILLLILFFIVAVGIALFQYYFTKKRSENWWWYFILRTITYFSLLLLLVNPKITNTQYTQEKPHLIVAIDNSESIAYFEETAKVNQILDEISTHKALSEKFDIDYYRFGNEFKLRDSLSFSEQQTKIDQVFSNLREIYTEQIAPMILISDGNQTLGEDYLYKALDQPNEVYAIAVGDTTQYSDIKIDRINNNRYSFLGNNFPVETFVTYAGDENVRKRFVIKSGNEEIFSKTLEFSPTKNSELVTTHIKTNSVGLKNYVASIETLTNEKNTSNNVKSFLVEVIDEQTNVLILSSILHPDLGAFKNAIAANKQRKATIKLINDKDLNISDYQLVILYQPNQRFNSVFTQIESQKINYILVTGEKTDYNFVNKTQEDFKKDLTNQTEEFQPFQNKDFGFFQQENIGFQDFPPLKDKFGEINITSEAQVLLYQNINGVVIENPILFFVEDNNHKKAYWFGENLWQWRAKAYRDSGDFVAFDNFMANLVQFTSSKKRKERLRVDAENIYNFGEELAISVSYFDKNYVFDNRAKINIRVSDVNTNTSKTYPFIANNNFYNVNLNLLPAGDYRYTVVVEGENLQKSGSFSILDYNIEEQFVNANITKLSQASKGKIYDKNQVEKLINNLIENENFKTIQKSTTQKTNLIDWKHLLAIIVLCLSAEWFLRKYRGLI
ncbi:VWA domain-containing protein [Mesonia sp. K7]|uniref:VWA domain-containing protein n=1 Tax=Mesonia sp. K7 TaxID=2218606 RepID=UPI000DA7C348|nr:VWA domain-containing protein [Mesonia sp. K7]PZD78189.1 VWA domain-containing protein [Mesonia sp. K7]